MYISHFWVNSSKPVWNTSVGQNIESWEVSIESLFNNYIPYSCTKNLTGWEIMGILARSVAQSDLVFSVSPPAPPFCEVPCLHTEVPGQYASCSFNCQRPTTLQRFSHMSSTSGAYFFKKLFPSIISVPTSICIIIDNGGKTFIRHPQVG